MIAHDQMVKGRKDLLIAILKEKINVQKLPANLRVYIRKFVSCLIIVTCVTRKPLEKIYGSIVSATQFFLCSISSSLRLVNSVFIYLCILYFV